MRTASIRASASQAQTRSGSQFPRSATLCGPGFLWSWIGQEQTLDRFRRLIGEADDARRRQGSAVGVILANHLVSAIDALIAARLRSSGRPVLESGLVPGPAGGAWALRLRLPFDHGHERDR